MKKALIVFICFCMLLSLQTVYGAGKEEQWETIKKVSHGKTTYLLLLNHETDELIFEKEERDKNERKVIYQTALGKADEKIKGRIMVKKDRLFITLSQQSGSSIYRLDEVSGEIKKKVTLPVVSKKRRIQKNQQKRVKRDYQCQKKTKKE